MQIAEVLQKSIRGWVGMFRTLVPRLSCRGPVWVPEQVRDAAFE
jgi:hypothetical protein